MRRGQYGRRIEYHTHPKYGGNVPIYLDTIGVFRAVFENGDVILQANTKNELIKLVDETLKTHTNLEWIPVIEIEFGTRWSNVRDHDEARNSFSSEVRIEVTRFWIAQKIDKHWIEAHWDIEHYPKFGEKKVETGDRLSRSNRFRLSHAGYDKASGKEIKRTEFTLPHTVKAKGRDEMPKYYVAYTEDLWITLKMIVDRMDDLQKKIIEILKTPESRAHLTANIQKLLPAPKGEK